MKNTYRAIVALIVWASILGQYSVLLSDGSFGGPAATTFAFFTYFTITTNILVGMAVTTPFLNPSNKAREFFDRQSVRAAIALYILVVAIIYYALLAKAHNPAGLSALFNYGLHLVVPALYILDWLIFAPKKVMALKSAYLWTFYPIAYGLFNIARGALTGFYPYPFLDISKLGPLGVSINMLGFAALYVAGAVGFIYLGRVLPSPKT